MPDRMHALAFNELSRALGEVDRFVALSERQQIADRLIAVVRPEALREAATAAEEEGLGGFGGIFGHWLRQRANRIEAEARVGGGGQEG